MSRAGHSTSRFCTARLANGTCTDLMRSALSKDGGQLSARRPGCHSVHSAAVTRGPLRLALVALLAARRIVCRRLVTAGRVVRAVRAEVPRVAVLLSPILRHISSREDWGTYHIPEAAHEQTLRNAAFVYGATVRHRNASQVRAGLARLVSACLGLAMARLAWCGRAVQRIARPRRLGASVLSYAPRVAAGMPWLVPARPGSSSARPARPGSSPLRFARQCRLGGLALVIAWIGRHGRLGGSGLVRASHGSARPGRQGPPRRCPARQVSARHLTAWPAGWATARLGSSRQARRVGFCRSSARLGSAGAPRRGSASRCLVSHGSSRQAWSGSVWPGAASRGSSVHGAAGTSWQRNASPGIAGPSRLVVERQRKARPASLVDARQRMAMQGEACFGRLGQVRPGELRRGTSWPARLVQVWLVQVRRGRLGQASLRPARHVNAPHVTARKASQRASCLRTAWNRLAGELRLGPASRGMSWHARRGESGPGSEPPGRRGDVSQGYAWSVRAGGARFVSERRGVSLQGAASARNLGMAGKASRVSERSGEAGHAIAGEASLGESSHGQVRHRCA